MVPAQNTDRQTPLAAPIAAPLVSSEMWAEASYPVCVYDGEQEAEREDVEPEVPPLIAPSKKPELLYRSPKTKLTLWWSSGTMISTRMITATPATCQNTEMLLNIATSGDE